MLTEQEEFDRWINLYNDCTDANKVKYSTALCALYESDVKKYDRFCEILRLHLDKECWPGGR